MLNGPLNIVKKMVLIPRFGQGSHFHLPFILLTPNFYQNAVVEFPYYFGEFENQVVLVIIV